MPSPTIAVRPCSFSVRITASFPSGSTPAMTSSTPASAPIACAVRSLSPVSMTTRMPIFCSSRTARGLSSLMTSATAMIPSKLPFSLKNSGVFPCLAYCSAIAFAASGIVACPPMKAAFPPARKLVPRRPVSPLPGTAVNSVRSPQSMPRSFASFRTARASGCSLFCSSAPAASSSASSVTGAIGYRSVTFGSPLVIVPVLSSATISVFPAFSRETAVLNMIPCFAPIPLPTMIATGVASPSAHGQLMTSTAIPRASANPTLCPVSSQPMIVRAAIVMTAGTKIPDTRSATFAIGAFVAAASLTIWIIWESVVSSPTRVASQVRKPD